MIESDPGSGHVTVDDGRLAVARQGDGRETIWLHGWTLDHRQWRPQRALADRWTMIMPDRRGFGQSSAPARLDLEWRDVAHLAEGRRIALVGQSQGGMVALDAALHLQEQVAALILVAAPLHGIESAKGLTRDVLGRDMREMVQDGQLDEMKGYWRGHDLMRVTPFARPLRDRMLQDYDGRDLLADPHPIVHGLSEVEALSMPVLAIVGDSDTPWRRACAELIAEHAPQGDLAVLPESGHLCNLERPDLFNEVVGAFLARHFPVEGAVEAA